MKYSIRQSVSCGNPKPIIEEATSIKKAVKQLYGDDGEIVSITAKLHPAGGHKVIVYCLDGNCDYYIVEVK